MKFDPKYFIPGYGAWKFGYDLGTDIGKPIGSALGNAAKYLMNNADITGSQAQQNEYDKNLALQEQAQAYNSAEAEKDRRFQERMSNTAYQRAFRDLEAAGYNPYIALNAGAASTPGGASGSSSAASVSRQNNQVISTTAKAVEGLMKLGQNSASNLSSVARIIAMAMIAL